MKKFKGFPDLKVWQKSKDVVVNIFGITGKFSKPDQNEMKQLLRETSVLASVQIAAGINIFKKEDKVKAFNEGEVLILQLAGLIQLCLSLDFIKDADFDLIHEDLEDCKKLLGGFRKYTLEREVPQMA